MPRSAPRHLGTRPRSGFCYAVRQLAKERSVTLALVLAIALGIGQHRHLRQGEWLPATSARADTSTDRPAPSGLHCRSASNRLRNQLVFKHSSRIRPLKLSTCAFSMLVGPDVHQFNLLLHCQTKNARLINTGPLSLADTLRPATLRDDLLQDANDTQAADGSLHFLSCGLTRVLETVIAQRGKPAYRAHRTGAVH